jgi:hypothetical protein
MANYTSLQAIREMAGVQNLNVKEVPTGSINSSNKKFYLYNLPPVDTLYAENGGWTTADLVAYVNGAAVTVAAVVVATGEVELSAAPATNSVVEITYTHSAVTDARVTQVRLEAQSWINSRLEGIVDYSDWTYANRPALLATITDLYAGGLILIRDYGSSADTDLSSKDGYKKMKQAEELLAQYLKDVADNSGSTTSTEVYVTGNGNIFNRETDLADNTELTPDTDFFNKDN